ncbi:MAG: flagellar protein FlbB [Treponema sp.]|nr:flagellar protein FlbB [Treponema sp.]
MIGKVFALLVLIAVLLAGGIFWFDHLHLIDARSVLAPVYGLFGREGRTQPRAAADEPISLDGERHAILMEAMDMRETELDTWQRDLDFRWIQIEQMAQELEERQRLLDDRENSLRALAADAENRRRNVEQNSRYLTGMPPQRAVGIISELDDQYIVDVFRMTEQIAQAEGNISLVSVWLSMMEPARAAEIQRRMVSSPQGM